MTTRCARLFIVLLGLTALACGHKGPPLPPPLRNPAPTTDLRIQQRGDELILEFTYPQTTLGGLPISTIEKVEYWELVKPLHQATEDTDGEDGDDGEEGAEGATGAEDAAGETIAGGEEAPGDAEPVMDDAEDETEAGAAEVPPPAAALVPRGAAPAVPLPPPPTKEQIAAVELLEFAATAQVRLVLEAEELAAATVGDKIVLRLPFKEAAATETAYVYSIKTFTDAKRVSNWSNLATLVRRDPPPTPENFTVEAQAGGVRIAWYNERAEARRKAIEEAAAAGLPAPPAAPPASGAETNAQVIKTYRVYRRDAQARVYGPYIGQVSADADEYLDRTAQYGSRYIYSLTAVGLYQPLVESALAGESEIDYQDRFAPPPPRNPVALADAGRVRILWEESPAPDLKGYVVLRREPGSADFTRLNAKLIVDLEYSDRDVAPGTRYEYRIAAVDRVGNEGDPSVTVSARTP